ncbi:hypothetical protein FV222_23750 [Methylobacterium sp. WL103]|nr:hypothetical protein FV222_23750 [Methylobacterium sp. WL103]
MDRVDIQFLHDALRDVAEHGRAPLRRRVAADVHALQLQDASRQRHLGHHIERTPGGPHLDREDRVVAGGMIDDDPNLAGRHRFFLYAGCL